MKYLIRGEDGKEYGPVDEETLRKWTEGGRVVPETPVRNVLIKKWNKAKDLDFLMPSFAMQQTRTEEEKTFFEKFSGHLALFIGKKKDTGIKEVPFGLSFKNKYVHDPATVSLRLGAVFFDFLIILLYALGILLLFSFLMNSGHDVNSSFNFIFYLFVIGIMLYYGIGLGLYAQTVGMWFWGIMIAKEDLGEVFMGRAYFFTVMMFLFGIISPIIVFLNPKGRSIHEILSGTRVIRISAKPKA